MNLKRKYGILMMALLSTTILVVIKLLVDSNSISFIPVNTLITAFLSGVFFTLAIVLNSAASDYKEAEKIPGELAVLFKSMLYDVSILKKTKLTDELKKDIKEMLAEVNNNFRSNRWKLSRIDAVADKINTKLSHLDVPPNFLIKLRSDLTQIDRLAHRVDAIVETSILPAAAGIAEIAVGIILLLIMFIKLDFAFGGAIIMGAVSLILISLLILIEDMDNPFRQGGAHVSVDLDTLFKLENYIQKK